MRNFSVLTFQFFMMLFSIILVFTYSCKKDEDENEVIIEEPTVVTDIDGNEYAFVTINGLTWMAENLKTTKLNDGTSLATIEDCSSDNLSPGFAWYEKDYNTYGKVYGGLYNWYAVNTGKLCPEGWRMPTKHEWFLLIEHLGGALEAGGSLKETGTAHWDAPNTGATNQSGFGALPGGYFGGVG